VRGFSAAGAAGILIEDQVAAAKACGHVSRGKRVVGRAEALARVRAAVDARDELAPCGGPNAPADARIVVVARSDARQAESLEEALWRAAAFADLGADVVFVDALASAGEMRRLVAALPRGTHAMANNLEGGGRSPVLSPAELEAIGFKLVAYPLSLLGAAAKAQQAALAAILAGGVPGADLLPSFEELRGLVGFPEYFEEAERYAVDGSDGASVGPPPPTPAAEPAVVFAREEKEEEASPAASPSSSPSSSIRPFLLDTQYRMHPALAEFPSGRWYASLLRDGVGEAQRRPPRGVEWPLDLRRRRGRGGPPPPGSSSSSPALLPVLFVPCDSPEQRCGFGGGNIGSGSGSGSGGDDAASASPLRTGTTFRNDGEAAAVLSALSSLLAAGDVPPSEIGIITPYAGQARALRAALGDAAGDAIEVRTVDGFQGREKSVVLFSAVRSNSRGSVGFLADGRRLNVALTRAKRGLIVLGNPETLRADGDWREWLKWWREASGGGGG